MELSIRHPAARANLSWSAAFFYWFAWLLALWLLTFWSIVLRARIYVGEWPSPGHFDLSGRGWQASTLDPKTFPLHDLAVWGGLLVLVMLLPLAVISLIASILVRSERPNRRVSMALLVLTALGGITLFLDPHGFMVWLAD